MKCGDDAEDDPACCRWNFRLKWIFLVLFMLCQRVKISDGDDDERRRRSPMFGPFYSMFSSMFCSGRKNSSIFMTLSEINPIRFQEPPKPVSLVTAVLSLRGRFLQQQQQIKEQFTTKPKTQILRFRELISAELSNFLRGLANLFFFLHREDGG